MAFSKTAVALMCSAAVLSGCSDGFDLDFRGLGNGPDTSEAARAATAARPTPDSRGLISYPTYQVAIAQRGDTVSDVANRLGINAEELASFNGIRDGVPLRSGATLVLPGAGVSTAPGGIDVASVATTAIERADGSAAPRVPSNTVQSGAEPVRHRVQAGETAFSIARIYNVTPRALADWNGLGENLEVRAGEILLIPVSVETAALGPVEVETVAPTTTPGAGSVAPEPPSAAEPLPHEEEPEVAAVEPASPQLEEERTQTARLLMPVSGSIARDYNKGTNDGIGISAASGASVVAADAGTVAAITRDTDQVPIVVLRHRDNLLTVYAGVEELSVEKGDTVTRGQVIGKLRQGSNPILHFEVRDGFESVDPTPYLN